MNYRDLLEGGQNHIRRQDVANSSILNHTWSGYSLIPSEKTSTARYERFMTDSLFAEANGDILICPGYPGRQKLDDLGRRLAHHGYTVHLPLHPGSQHEFDGKSNTIDSESSFSDAYQEIRAYFLKYLSLRRGQPLILGGYSTGTLLASQLLGEFPDDISQVFVISGVFNPLEYFEQGVFKYKHHQGWSGIQEFFKDCVDKQDRPGNVPLAGDPRKISEDFRRVVGDLVPLEKVCEKKDKPLSVIHSQSDEVVPYSYAQRFFPEASPVVTPEMDHELRSERTDTTQIQEDIADALYMLFTLLKIQTK